MVVSIGQGRIDTDGVALCGLSLGGMIMVDGQRSSLGRLGGLLQRWDWTAGCIAVRALRKKISGVQLRAGPLIRIQP